MYYDFNFISLGEQKSYEFHYFCHRHRTLSVFTAHFLSYRNIYKKSCEVFFWAELFLKWYMLLSMSSNSLTYSIVIYNYIYLFGVISRPHSIFINSKVTLSVTLSGLNCCTDLNVWHEDNLIVEMDVDRDIHAGWAGGKS